jgi:predicted DsbA family dithiol-disulfide isomerase
MVKQDRSDEFEIRWKPFSLAQVNQKMGEGYKVWDEPENSHPPGLWGLRASVAAGRQGQDLLDRFLMLLLTARHVDRKELGDLEVLRNVASETGLDVDKFMKDLSDPSSLQEVIASHEEAAQQYGVFGTPTFRFSSGASAFLKILRPDTQEQALRSFDLLKKLMEDELFVGEFKRPQPPWPKGVFNSP